MNGDVVERTAFANSAAVVNDAADIPEEGAMPLIALEGVCRLYKSSVLALKEIDLKIYPGEYVAIMGPSGSGKSTLMNILGCLDLPSSGRYLLGGEDVTEMTERQLARVRNREIGFVFQSFNLLSSYTALENVALPLVYAGVGPRERAERAAAALAEVGLEARAGHRPAEMSGGQRQRVAIARALINHPSLILADEPTGNLDTATSMDIMELLQNIHASGRTIVLVTHENSIADCAKRFVRLRDGIIVEDKSLKR